MEAKKRFAVLLCAEDSEYVKKVYGGYLRVFMALLEEEEEEWDVYMVAKGEFPPDDIVPFYDGFVVTGSRSDADSDDPWIQNLVALLRRLHELRKKVLGICFGHQYFTEIINFAKFPLFGTGIQGLLFAVLERWGSNPPNRIWICAVLCRALGGKTGRAINGWDIGVTCIHPSPSLSKLLVPPHFPVIQCHRDEVLELPPFVEILARSEKTGIEMFRCGDHILGIQGHPEYTKGILLHLVELLLQHSIIKNCQAEAIRASLNAREPDREAWERLCKGFLKGRLGSEFEQAGQPS